MMQSDDQPNNSTTQSSEQTNNSTESETKAVDVRVEKNSSMDDAESIFSVKRPKDVFEGLGQGAGNILKGAFGGAAIMVAAPIKGAYDGSTTGTWGAVKGFGAGLGMGIIGGTSMVVGGVVTGVAQIGRGVINTPGSISASTAGKDWDPESREWIVYDLQKEKDLLNMSDEEYIKLLKNKKSGNDSTPDANSGENMENEASNRPLRKVADHEYYDILGIPTNATSGEIKKAYYVKAKQSHPDRHPNDPEAHQKFQKIGQAYQILSDEKLRANYDAGGKDGVESAPKADPAILFAMIFGSDKFVPLVGELKLASQMNEHEENASDSINNHAKLRDFRQKKREITCALNLAEKLQPYILMNCDEKAYRELLKEEVKELSSSPFGSTLVGTIGQAYVEYATSELSSINGLAVGITQTARSVTTSLSIASEGLRAAYMANEMSKSAANKKKSPTHQEAGGVKEDVSDIGSSSTDPKPAVDEAKEEKKEELDAAMKAKMEKLSGHMFTVLWHMTEMDIRSTLAKVCQKVCHDHSVDEKIRLERVKALKILGEYFVENGGTMKAGLGDIKARLGAQMNANQSGDKTKSSNTTTDNTTNSSGSKPVDTTTKANATNVNSGYNDSNVD